MFFLPGGEFEIYAFKQKDSVRQFVDRYIRDRIFAMTYDKALNQFTQINESRKVLSKIGLKLSVPVLESLVIKASEYKMQYSMYSFCSKWY